MAKIAYRPVLNMHVGTNEIIIFSAFLLFIFLMLGIDLGIFNKKSHTLSFHESLSWTAVWVGVSILFYVVIRFYGNELHGLDSAEKIQMHIDRYHHPISILNLPLQDAIHLYNRNLSLEYMSGYLIEYSLSVDNIFVIIMIFLSFNISSRYYKKILFWGILGAIIMRFIFIFAASALIQQFSWFLYIFGILLLILGGKMGWEFFKNDEAERIDPKSHPVVKMVSKIFAVSTGDHGSKFWIVEKRKFLITPLFIVLVVIEFSDVLFAVDSVPAVFSVTRDPFIVFFSNIFAILGLRSLFFLVMNVMNRFRFLKLGLAVLLFFVGIKMLIHLPLSSKGSFGIIIGILAFFVLLSMVLPEKKRDK
ncbi:MAG: TerC/Alx family metal homeostasis membrane protein [Bacteroidetes bacterium]|nr:TerC/Alx family metal homeostasis membrane protein [Bacteroidota bacterium]